MSTSGEARSPAHATAATLFRLGINYWPARTAMGFWPAFDRAEVRADFGRIAASGLDSVRIFLTWEDFQPAASRVDKAMVQRLVTTMDEAATAGLAVMPTLFTGHMSGANFIPPWALGEDSGDDRFAVVSEGRLTASRLASWYADATIVEAQSRLARHLAGALAGHDALYAWDLGNENSNCSVAPDGMLAREWLARVTCAIRDADPRARLTVGLHMEDLEEDRKLGPREAAEVCDFLTMHGYPGYASWADSPTDERVLPFLARVTGWLGGGADVLFSEFGVPTSRNAERAPTQRAPTQCAPTQCAPTQCASVRAALVSEEQAAAYVDRALASLLACGSTGAMLWCYADYAPTTWTQPPLDRAAHERSFGLWRADGSPKPAVAVIEAFAERHVAPRAAPHVADSTWIDLDAATFLLAPGRELPRLYRRYCEALEAGAAGDAPDDTRDPALVRAPA